MPCVESLADMLDIFPPLPKQVQTDLAHFGIRNAQDLRHADPCRVFLLLKQNGGITKRVFWQLAALAQGLEHTAQLSDSARAVWEQRLRDCPPVALFPPPNEMEKWMRVALLEAKRAGEAGEIPVGAVVVHKGNIIAGAGNACIARNSVGAHAEILALEKAGKMLHNYRLNDCDVYVSLEPCCMCASALIQARVRRVIYAAPEPKTGAAGSITNLFALKTLNAHTAVLGGIMAEQSQELMRSFFRQRRQRPCIPEAEEAQTSSPETDKEPT